MAPTAVETWYDDHAAAYAAQTVDAPLHELRDDFCQRLNASQQEAKPRAILDLGCGSGRDARAFALAGYAVSACDASAKLAALASTHAGIEVQHSTFDECLRQYDAQSLDGIWACASLLHSEGIDNLVETLRLIARALRPEGVAYVSFKHGHGGTIRNAEGRRFLDMDRISLQDAVALAGLRVERCWVAQDSLDAARRPAWLNAYLTPSKEESTIAAIGAAATAPAVIPPGWVQAMATQQEASSQPLPSRNPAEDPDKWILAHVDVETTGLAPGYHEMIDLGVRILCCS